MQQTYRVTLLKFVERKWEGRKYYIASLLTQDFEHLDVNVQQSLVEAKPEVLVQKGVSGMAHVSIVSGQRNKATFILTDFIPDRQK